MVEPGGLAPRDVIEHAERPSAGGLTRQFRRAENRKAHRYVGVAAVGHAGVYAGGAADAARIEVPGGAAESDVGSGATKVEDRRAFDKERPALLEKLLERREVHQRGVLLHLAEVGVDRGVAGFDLGDELAHLAFAQHPAEDLHPPELVALLREAQL